MKKVKNMNEGLTSPRYSIIVPVYNVKDYLQECVDSLLAQDTEEAYEILLVDDGSKDGSGLLCDECAAKDVRIRVIHKENGGVSSARNTGIEAARGTYIFFVDSDDILEPRFLTPFAPLLNTAPDLALCSNVRFEEGGEEVVEPLPLVPEGESGKEYLALLFSKEKLPRPYVWSVAFKRDFLEVFHLLFREDLPISEDFEFMLRCYSAAKQVRGVDSPLYRYRMRPDSLSHRLSWKKLQANLQVKIAAYRQYPCGAMANYFADSAVMISRLSDGQRFAEKVIRENCDILKWVTQPPLKIFSRLVSLLGPIRASRVWLFLQDRKNDLRRCRKN